MASEEEKSFKAFVGVLELIFLESPLSQPNLKVWQEFSSVWQW